MSFYYKEYVSLAQKQEKAKRAIAKLSKKQNIEPLVYNDPKKCKAWWAIKWEENMKNYSDFSNRISRGRAYVKNGFVIDMKITKGNIEALVMGTRAKPYEVEIQIAPLDKKKEEKLIEKTKNQISNLESLIKGDFPKDLAEIFMSSDLSLFPKPNEIKFDCSCPDYAYMCKHVAAVIFGVSSKLCSNPLLFFTLRGIDADSLIKASTDKIVDNMLKNASKKPKNIIDNSLLDQIFGL